MQNKTVYMSLVNGENALTKKVNNYMDKLTVFFTMQKTQFYMVFMDYIEFADFLINIYEEFRCYHEVIFDVRQKMRFDIDSKDVNININELIEEIISACIQYLNKFSIILDLSRDIVITSSNGEGKLSYHIILDNYCVKDHYNAKLFFKFVISKISTKYRSYIDNSVYKSIQNFRILYNKKTDSNRVKKIVYEWKYKDQIIKYKYKFVPNNTFQRVLLELNATLISETSGCKLLPYKNKKNKKINISEIDDKKFLIVKEKIYEMPLMSAFKILNVVDNIICLKRIKPSYCEICKREHEHENPYIKITDNRCEFYCRRNEKPMILFNFQKIQKFNITDKDKEELLKKSYINCVINNF